MHWNSHGWGLCLIRFDYLYDCVQVLFHSMYLLCKYKYVVIFVCYSADFLSSMKCMFLLWNFSRWNDCYQLSKRQQTIGHLMMAWLLIIGQQMLALGADFVKFIFFFWTSLQLMKNYPSSLRFRKSCMLNYNLCPHPQNTPPPPPPPNIICVTCFC